MKIDRLWVVTDPTPNSVIEDILFDTSPVRFPYYVIGTGADRWRAENTTLYTEEAEARADAEARLRNRQSV